MKKSTIYAVAAIVLALTAGCDGQAVLTELPSTTTDAEYGLPGTPEVDETNPTEETPAEETPTEETPTEETPTEETPTEETPTEETPTEETPTEETPTEETPTEETPTEETPTEETPAEETPTEEAPAEETPAEETPTEEPVTEPQACAITEQPLTNAVLEDDYWLINYCGWQLQMHSSLYNDDMASPFYNSVADDLQHITSILPGPAVDFLKNTTIWMELESTAVTGGVYHPSPLWLEQNNYPIKWANGIQLDRHYLLWGDAQPAMLLHELAHALHHQYYDFNQPDLTAAFQQAMQAGIYDSVEHNSGNFQTAYAASNDLEYFAELTEAIYWENDYYPFNLQQLESHDPAGRLASQNMWEQVQPQATASQQTPSNFAHALASSASYQLVKFVYFIEKGETYDEAEYQAIKSQALNLQQYWYEQFGGTFYLYDDIVSVIYGDETSEWYRQTPDDIHDTNRWYRLGNIKKEVYRKLGIEDFNSQIRVVSYPTSQFDGLVGADFGGVWMDGDDLNCIHGNNGGYTIPFYIDSPATCLGHLAHEFGHLYGLEHRGEADDCMQAGFYVNESQGAMCDFGADNRSFVVNNTQNAGWLDALPGEVVNPDGTVSIK